MTWLARLRAWARVALQAVRVEREMDAELQFHLDARADDLVAAGLDRAAARQQARRELGDPTRWKELGREALGLGLFDRFGTDLRHGVRLLGRQPGFTTLAILTMGLGIGATTTLISVTYGVALKPLPWPEADRLVRVTETRDGRTGRVPGTVTNATFLAWRDQPSTIEDLGGWLTRTATLTGAGDPVRIPINPITPGLFEMLRARPLIGRSFLDGEGTRGAPSLVILSHGLWQERFGGHERVLSQVVQLDGQPHAIVGVMPREFAFPDRETRAWTAWSVPSVAGEGVLQGVIFRALSRLRPGATPEQAAAEATSRARGAPDLSYAANALFGATGPIDVTVVPEIEAMTAEVRPALFVLLAAVALLLVIAMANIASVQLARATTRRREMAVRAAIGAGQHRLAGQMLIENAVLGLCGGAAGVAVAVGLLWLLPSLLPAGFPRLEAVAIDRRVLLAALAVAAAASGICGMLPARYARRVNLVETLSEDGTAPAGGGARTSVARTRGVIMVGQVAMTCVLLVGAALLARSFVALMRADRGYDPSNVLTARLPVPPGYPVQHRDQMLDRLVERLRAVPGVTHAGYSTALPLVSAGGFTAFTMPSPRNPGVDVDVQAVQRIVSPDYFAAMRLRLVDGRVLSEADTSGTPPAIVVNRTFARQFLGERPLGIRLPQNGPRAGGFRFAGDQSEWEVVGVVEDMRQDSVDSPPQPEIFASFGQVARDSLRSFDPIVVIRTASDPIRYAPTLHALVREQAPTLALDSVMTMEDRVMTSLARPRLYAIVLTSCGLFALLISGVGLFGVLSFSVAQRTREIGVRSALGGRTRDIISLVLRQVLWIVGIGVSVGLTVALVSVQVVSRFLYGVSPRDAWTVAAVPVAVVMVAALACVVPAWRAAGLGPSAALRCR